MNDYQTRLPELAVVSVVDKEVTGVYYRRTENLQLRVVYVETATSPREKTIPKTPNLFNSKEDVS